MTTRVIIHTEYACTWSRTPASAWSGYTTKESHRSSERSIKTDRWHKSTSPCFDRQQNRTYHMQSIAVDDAVLLHEISGYRNRGKIQALGGKLRCKFISLRRQLVTKALEGQQYICHPQRGVWLGRGGNGWDFKLLIPKARRVERLLEKHRTRQTTSGHAALSNHLRTCGPNLVWFLNANSIRNQIFKVSYADGVCGSFWLKI